MTRYRYLDAMGDVVAEADFADHTAAIAAVDDVVADLPDDVEAVQRVEFLGPGGDWRWAGPVPG